jgi:hypothetical protein
MVNSHTIVPVSTWYSEYRRGSARKFTRVIFLVNKFDVARVKTEILSDQKRVSDSQRM